MNYPLISIVMATYNGEQFLREQIESLLAQTYPNLEIIISDDNSKDNTCAILEAYKHYPHIKIYRNNANAGFIKNFEKAALFAKGEYIAFCDQDDIWLPEKTMELFKAIGAHSLVYSDSSLIDENGSRLQKSLSDFKPLQDIYDVSGLAFFNIVPGHTMLLKKEVLQAALPFPAAIQYHDWYIALEAAKQNGCIYLDKKLTLYRQHAHTCTKTIQCKNLQSRSLPVRYAHFLSTLKWLALIMNTCQNEQKAFFEKLHYLYKQNTQTMFNFPLFFFLLKNHKKLYRFTNKSLLSRIVDIRKIARGERIASEHLESESFHMQST